MTAVGLLAAADLHSAAADLDAALGDPADPGNPCGFQAMVDRAESGSFPEALTKAAGPALRLSYVPLAQGGDLVRYDDLFALVRVAARRDLTVMPATMIDITATSCVLLSGSQEQRERVVELLRGGGSIGFSFSEPDHGSDLLANTCTLTAAENGWRLDGVKWLTGFGGPAEAALVIASTGGRGPAAFSAVLLDKPLEPWQSPDSATTVRFQQVAGMRGAHYAEIRYADVPIAAEALVGQVGHGMETAMKAMQIVRATSTAANLAAADSALRLTLDFAHRHVVAGKPVDQHPANRRELGTAAAALIAADAAALGCVRAMHTFPEKQSLWSGTLKTVLTALSEEVFARCADVLGSRSVLREGAAGAFDVLRADNAAVRFFDTSPTANQRLVVMQLGAFRDAEAAADAAADTDKNTRTTGTDPALLAATFDLGRQLPPLEFDRLALAARGRDVVTGELAHVLVDVRAAIASAALDPDVLEADAVLLLELLSRLEAELASAASDIRAAASLPPALRGTTQLDLAARVAYLHAAASCVHLWSFNRQRSLYGCPPGALGWLTASLALLLDRAAERTARLSMPLADQAYRIAAGLWQDVRMFSAVPLQLAGRRAGCSEATDKDDAKGPVLP
ncbi:acyl-CoA dehydrogenase family protein [Catenulispora rubra]|uniref:acyl-CoA dehydrogenase family protein n=1 Tax=Catenulispora rubra TaxID=280293 RepID=UPI002B273E31|nr:acyl-CoA dehydrogenase family protein [Catenulispora rubra]